MYIYNMYIYTYIMWFLQNCKQGEAICIQGPLSISISWVEEGKGEINQSEGDPMGGRLE